jgi:hypothetical protein
VAGLDVLVQRFDVSLALAGARDVHRQPLGDQRRERERSDLPPDAGPPGAFAASDNERPLGSERAKDEPTIHAVPFPQRLNVIDQALRRDLGQAAPGSLASGRLRPQPRWSNSITL